MAGVGFLRNLWEKQIWESVPTWVEQDSVFVRSASTEWNVPRECGAHGELLCFLIQELEKMPGCETFGPFFNADIRTLLSLLMSSRSAPVALHEVAEERRDGEVGCRASGVGTNGRIGYPKSPMWESEGKVWSKDETVSSSGSREGTVSNDALHVVASYSIESPFRDFHFPSFSMAFHHAPFSPQTHTIATTSMVCLFFPPEACCDIAGINWSCMNRANSRTTGPQ